MAFNYVAILVAALIHYALGALWYGPLFGKPWMKMMGINAKNMKPTNMGARYFGAFVTALIIAFVLAYFIMGAGASNVMEGMAIAFFLWLGFIATVLLTSVLWENKPFSLYVLNIGYYLVGFLIMGAILAGWQ